MPLPQEMNVLLEGKLEAEGRAAAAEAAAQRLQGQLSAYDRTAAQVRPPLSRPYLGPYLSP